MMMPSWLDNGWLWLAVTILVLGLCTFLPIKVTNDAWRRTIYWVILIPLSLVLIGYVYPFGIEVFRRLAIGG